MNTQPRELVILTQAEQMLARATTVDEVKDIRDRAEAVRGYSRKIGLSRDIIVHAAAIKVNAERKLGELLKVTALARGAPGNQYTGKELDRSHDATGPIHLRDWGISKSDSSRAQQIASLPAPAFDRYVKSCIESGQEPTIAGLLKLVVRAKSDGKMVVRIQGLTGEFEWYTPRKYLNAAIEVMGGIDLDPASSDLAQKHVKAKRFYAIRDDGRKQAWAGRVFLNPPYAMPYIKQFAEKMARAWAGREIAAGIMLVNNATDTEWFHTLLNACAAVCLTRGRISFLEAANGAAIEKKAPTHGQAFFYFGSDVPRFARVFAKFGKTLLAYKQDRTSQGFQVMT
jgi:phage N-6-adenine-methyltransferase